MNEEPGDNPTAGKPNHADEKARLECEKLRAEIKAIQRPHLTPVFYVALCPVVLAVLTVAGAWWSGWFDVQRTRLSNEKTLIEAQTEQLRTERATLDREAQEQRSHVTRLEAEVSRLKEEQSALTNQIGCLERDRDEMRAAKELFASEARRLAGSETNAIRMLKRLETAQAEREMLTRQLLQSRWTNAFLNVSLSQREDLVGEMLNIISAGVSLVESGASHRRLEEYVLRTKIFSIGHPDLDFAEMAWKERQRKSGQVGGPAWQVEPDPTNKVFDSNAFRAQLLKDATNPAYMTDEQLAAWQAGRHTTTSTNAAGANTN